MLTPSDNCLQLLALRNQKHHSAWALPAHLPGISNNWWMAVQVGGTFWLTRLSRDREASVRVAALGLLAHLASPRAPATRRMLLQGWPEAGTALLKV